ncbi:FAD-dependent oxidoreductase [Rhodococcus sp. IEGM 1307]|uniref:NAD(P)/FAD-dependent oxidoreductase n=1 Tax=Rhodococcus sp. IEGM 1307 TaxID=3047091 RepID=UPI0024B706B8|nr:FAD-dependent oxidoreductase [Rhodococcus sp. IEGM 1307]MDI9979609.1 FAD-dependent oxidoreductase [Rhodococcus sp. IEGM 1307]
MTTDGVEPSAQYDVVVVGTGHGGAHAAASLRQHGFTGSVALVGDEPDLPYERPPLSKDYLSGDTAIERLLIHPASFWHDRGIDVLTGRRVVAVDADAHQVRCADEAVISYRHLVWAGGGVPRTLTCPGHDLGGVHTVRTTADVDRIRAELSSTSRVVVIGGGYIGLETAAVLGQAGKHITVLEAQDRVLARVAGAPLASFYQDEHQTRGVDIRLGVTVERIEGRDSRVSGVSLSDGELLPCDLVIVGIGITPAVEPLLSAGAAGAGGVEIDEQCRTTLPDVFAIGDCAVHRNRYADGEMIRLESVQNAHDQATIVAKVLSGEDAEYDAVPWFWSKQYDLRLQTVGLSSGHDETVVRGDPATRRFSVIYLRHGRVIALDCVNSVKDFVQGKRLVAEGSTVDATLLADPTTPLNKL